MNHEYKNIGIDESLFIRDENGIQEWLVGLIDISNDKVRLEVEKNVMQI